MTASPVTPYAGLTNTIAVGGTPVNVSSGGENGGIIVNPSNPNDQNIGGSVESIYVNPLGAATLSGFGQTFEIPPGSSWALIPGQTTVTSVNAATSGHRFSVVLY